MVGRHGYGTARVTRRLDTVRSEHAGGLLVQPLDLELISYLSSSPINRVGRKLQYTRSLQGHNGDAERPKMFLDIYDLILLAEEDEINGE
jgi:hypothetical protein